MKLAVVELDNGIRRVKLNGRLDIQGVSAVDTAFTAHVASTKAAVLIDLTDVDFVASLGIRLLLSNARSLAARGGKLVLYNPAAAVHQTLTVAGIGELIPIHQDFDAACADLGAVPGA